ncbi:hypothetical protein I2I05_08185 [Hymenobacter sp. BT683]|uniref:DUF4234 domain-containing protein n=1 Tax=Hymenobacter jeongseonensis TaxID=2791027 RepID=A0ABS0IG86_9BACT|nr:hypothetical protein [Hymenobacter jeongseonensis]MBF9237374.1 hypothetical protein [Hymenobacter jeongseonensis]
MERWRNYQEGRYLLVQLLVAGAFLGLTGWLWYSSFYSNAALEATGDSAVLFAAIVAVLYSLPFAGWQAGLVYRRKRGQSVSSLTSILVLLISLFPVGVIVYLAIIIGLGSLTAGQG